VLELLATADPDRKWTPRDIIKHRSIGGLGPVLVGGPKTVADEMERWVDVGGIDGFNLAYAITPGTFEDLVEFIVPELQRRGRVRTSYEGDTLRENLLDGTSPYAADDHPAARYRGAFKTGANATDHTKPSKFSDLT